MCARTHTCFARVPVQTRTISTGSRMQLDGVLWPLSLFLVYYYNEQCSTHTVVIWCQGFLPRDAIHSSTRHDRDLY